MADNNTQKHNYNTDKKRSKLTLNLNKRLAHNTLGIVKVLLTILHSFDTFSRKEFHEKPVNDRIE